MELIVARHETCLEYFKRRLSEGWECIEFSYPYAVLLSPEDIRRKLDLRNDIETLSPSAGGDVTQLKYYDGVSHDPDVLHNFEQVDEYPDPDEGSTSVFCTNRAGPFYDLYNLPAHTGSGTINKVTVYARCSLSAASNIRIKTNETEYDSDAISGYAWETHSYEWAQNPSNSHAWTWDEIDALQVGIYLVTDIYDPSECTQVYIEVDYSLEVGLENKSANMGAKMVAAGLI